MCWEEESLLEDIWQTWSYWSYTTKKTLSASLWETFFPNRRSRLESLAEWRQEKNPGKKQRNFLIIIVVVVVFVSRIPRSDIYEFYRLFTLLNIIVVHIIYSKLCGDRSFMLMRTLVSCFFLFFFGSQRTLLRLLLEQFNQISIEKKNIDKTQNLLNIFNRTKTAHKREFPRSPQATRPSLHHTNSMWTGAEITS